MNILLLDTIPNMLEHWVEITLLYCMPKTFEVFPSSETFVNIFLAARREMLIEKGSRNVGLLCH